VCVCVCVCDRGASMMSPWPTRGYRAIVKKILNSFIVIALQYMLCSAVVLQYL
jgi:hypothetical protein